MYSDYYNWLLDRVGVTISERQTYSFLFRELFKREFKWTIERDENRAADGEDLRREFEEETGSITDDYDNCNMLEMLVALSVRCENDIMALPDEDNTYQWFWEMLKNLGLDYYNNDRFSPVKVGKILDNVIFRRYDRNGKGGLFPLRNAKTDQRGVEIWYQMGSWLCENFDLVE